MFETAMLFDLLEKLCKKCYENSKAHGFWDGPDNDNIPTKLALIHSEVSEMLEAFRKGNPPCEKEVNIIESADVRRITSMEEEVADILIRLCDLCGKLDIDLGRVTLAKMNYNEKRTFKHGGKKV